MQRRRYSQEFKREAMGLTNQSGVTIRQTGEEPGINPNMLGRRKKELTTSRGLTNRQESQCRGQ